VSEPSTGMMVTSNVRLLRPLGEGGMGSVWVGEHLSLRTHVVVKFMANDLAQNPEALARFSREAAAASQVKSPHVVQMFDHGVTGGGAPYIVMELLEGRDLEQEIRARGRLDPREVVAIVAQLARALGKAHERGIMHRDIKPSNVFLCDVGGGELFVKLLDFGIAKGQGAGLGLGVVGSTTRSGAFMGSPLYMSPEQVVGAKTIDFRTDLWSLGVVTFEALTGDRPFFAETVGALALKIHRDPLPVPSKVHDGLGPAVDAWFARACAREPVDRFASARQLADALAEAVAGMRAALLPSAAGVSAPGVGPGFETTYAASSPMSMAPPGGPSISDARSETSSEVGVTPSKRPPITRTRRWVWLGAIAAVVAAGGGLMVPGWMAKPRDAPASPAPEPSPAFSAALSTLAPPAAAAPLAIVPVSPTTPPVASTRTASALPPPARGSAVVAQPARIKPAAPAPTSSAVALPSAAPPSRPPPGSEDDIK
jgi:eukaryotic-like serine/threonine-protein kinase